MCCLNEKLERIFKQMEWLSDFTLPLRAEYLVVKYDQDGNIVYTEDENGHIRTSRFDDNGNELEVKIGRGGMNVIPYNRVEERQSYDDGDQHKYRYCYDKNNNQVLEQQYFNGKPYMMIHRIFDKNNNLIAIVDETIMMHGPIGGVFENNKPKITITYIS